MAHVFSPAGSSAFGAGRRARRVSGGVDWRVVLMTGVSAVLVIIMLGGPLA